ncbi:MAG: hypothetical protein M1835_003168 [Candelina submexicana]|nr:MAG: hypothetical protein M1835_003168 [Candelina submexicana]
MARCTKCHNLLDNPEGDGVTEKVGALCRECTPKRHNRLYSVFNKRTVKDRVKAYEQQHQKETEARKQRLGLEEAQADGAAEMRKAAEDSDGKTCYKESENQKISQSLEQLEEPRAFETSKKFWDDVRARLQTDPDDDTRRN